MGKSEVTKEEAEGLIDRVAKELGLLRSETKSCHKIQGPENKHRIYVFKSKFLGRIETTLPLPSDDPAYRETVADNGSITCTVDPSKEQLERALRMLGDKALGVQVPNKPRPFAPTKAPAPRKPRPVEPPLEAGDVDAGPVGDDGRTINQRLQHISERARTRRVERLVDEHGIPRADAEAVADKKVTLAEVLAARDARTASELKELQAESGIEVVP